MTIEQLKNQIPDFGKDIRLNLDAVLSEEGAPGLSKKQIWSIAAAVGYSLRSGQVLEVVRANSNFDDVTVEAAKGAAAIMAMNNIYYRAQHLMEDPQLKVLPAKLRMNIIGKPGVEKADFELMCFAVSAISGCGQCLTAHLHELRKAGLEDLGIQSALRIASVLNAAVAAIDIALI